VRRAGALCSRFAQERAIGLLALGVVLVLVGGLAAVRLPRPASGFGAQHRCPRSGAQSGMADGYVRRAVPRAVGREPRGSVRADPARWWAVHRIPVRERIQRMTSGVAAAVWLLVTEQ